MNTVRFVLLLMLVTLLVGVARADIYRWDTGEVIPGTQGITPGPEINLSNQQLSFAELDGEELWEANFRFSTLDSARFDDSHLRAAQFEGAALSFSSFQEANLEQANLQMARAADSNFNGAFLQSARLAATDLRRATFHGADLRNANMAQATLVGAELDNADIRGVTFSEALGVTFARISRTASFKTKDLSGVNFTDVDVVNWNLSNQNLQNTRFGSAYFTGANFAGADILGAQFYGTSRDRIPSKEQIYSTASYQQKDLRGIHLVSPGLVGWDFSGQNLSGAYFWNTVFDGSDFSGADLTDANLGQTSLANVSLAGAIVQGANLSVRQNTGLTREQFYSTASYQTGELQRVKFLQVNLIDWNFENKVLTGAVFSQAHLNGVSFRDSQLSQSDFSDALLSNADLTGAEIRSANFSGATTTGLLREQFYSTKSYQDGDLTGIRLERNDLAGWDFSHKTLSDASFSDSRIAGASFRDTTSRGLTIQQLRATQSWAAKQLTNVDLSENSMDGWRFSSIDLTDASLRNTSLKGSRFDGATLTNADFTGADLENADFSGTVARGFTAQQLYSSASYQEGRLNAVKLPFNDLSGWDFSSQNLTGALFRDSYLSGANFAGATIQSADFSDTVAKGFTRQQFESTQSFADGSFAGVKLDRNDMAGWNFTDADLSEASFREADFRNATFRNARLVGAFGESANFTGADLESVELSNSILSHANFTNANLRQIRMSSVEGEYARFMNARLDGADLSGSEWTSADFSGAVLTSALLAHSDFRSAKFEGANLRGADLSHSLFSEGLVGADLTNATIRGASLHVTSDMLYSTASYQNRDLRGVRLGGAAGWNFDGQDISGGAVLGNIENASFRFAMLMGTDLHTHQVDGADFTGARIEGATISQGWTQEMLSSTASYQMKSLNGVKFYNVRMPNWDFANFDLTDAVFESGDLRGARLANAKLQGAAFQNSVHLQDADFSSADIRGTTFRSVTNYGLTYEMVQSTASYELKNLNGVKFVNCELDGWDFSGFELKGASFASSSLHAANLNDANLTGAVFDFAKLANATFDNAQIQGASFAGTIRRNSVEFSPEMLYSTASYRTGDLSGVNFRDNYMPGWDFHEQNLSFANFRQANLESASVRGAVLHNADFSYADLEGADFKFSDARGATFSVPFVFDFELLNAIRPDASIHELAVNAGDEMVIRNYLPQPDCELTDIRVVEGFNVATGGVLRLMFDELEWNSTFNFSPYVEQAELNGDLALQFADGVDVVSQVGRTIHLFDWTGVEPIGEFNIASQFPWDVSKLYTTGEVTLLMPGDTNGDLTVNLADLNNVRNNFGNAGLGDTNNDGIVDLEDLNNVRNFFGASAPQPVPEPATFVIACVAFASVGFAVRTRKRSVRH